MSPLLNKTVLLTRSREQSAGEISMLEDAGAEVIAFPAIKILPKTQDGNITAALNELGNYNYIVFTSANAVKHFNGFLETGGKVIPRSVKVVCTGDKTAETCRKFNIDADIVPEEFSASSIIKYFSSMNLQGQKFLVPASNIARDELSSGLISLGADIVMLPIYEVAVNNEIPEMIEFIKTNKPDAFIFTSPSSFAAFNDLMKIENTAEYFFRKVVVAIGRTTENAISEKSVRVALVPETFTVENCVKELIKYYQKEYLLN
ncbi:MAG: uroporphyrinogen-III synthase [Melioribacteraceae bacterium]|nr:uroporphyrinogen-III synthase [Melioribacteraceae bacterium]